MSRGGLGGERGDARFTQPVWPVAPLAGELAASDQGTACRRGADEVEIPDFRDLFQTQRVGSYGGAEKSERILAMVDQENQEVARGGGGGQYPVANGFGPMQPRCRGNNVERVPGGEEARAERKPAVPTVLAIVGAPVFAPAPTPESPPAAPFALVDAEVHALPAPRVLAVEGSPQRRRPFRQYRLHRPKWRPLRSRLCGTSSGGPLHHTYSFSIDGRRMTW